MIGTSLGPYEIVSRLGAGGMGEVWRPRDTRLGRDVAIKVLPAHLSASPEIRARFEREARAISKLNHPHICTLHDIGRQEEIDYIVMELLEGETLAHRLEKGPLPIAEVLKVGTQIADAVGAAHRSGVVHRDLKPANVMLTKGGVKLMDFGLARSTEIAPVTRAVAESPTVSRPLTAEGTIVGTFQYMAPEQLEGKTADARCDLWALGCVLYEMTTGKRAFEGKSQASLIAAILKETPRPVSELQPLAPPALERIVNRCMEKDPDERFQSARDLAFDLHGVAESSSSSIGEGTRAVAAPPARRRWIWMAITLASVGVAVVALIWRGPADGVGHRRATFADLALPAGVRTGSPALVSSDGRQVRLLGADRTGTHYWLRDLDSGGIHELPLLDLSAPLAWSADGRRIVSWFPDNLLKELDVESQVTRTLGPFPNVPGRFSPIEGTLNRAGDMLVARWGLVHVPASGGAPTVVASPDAARGEVFYHAPGFLPDGRHYLFSVLGLTGEQSAVYAGTLGSSARKRVLGSISWAAFAQGYLLFRRDTTLFAQPFDPEGLQLSGEPAPLADDLWVSPWGFATAWVSGETLVYLAGPPWRSQLTWFDRSGRESGRLGDPAEIVTFDLSPGGTAWSRQSASPAASGSSIRRTAPGCA
ncbi:MAG: serine/threonine-protein kinase [Acidobacteriota bacterium]